MPKRIFCVPSFVQPRCKATFLMARRGIDFFGGKLLRFQFSTDNFSCCTRQEQRYRQARAQQKLNVAPHLLQLQSDGPGKSVNDVLKKTGGRKKKCCVCISSG